MNSIRDAVEQLLGRGVLLKPPLALREFDQTIAQLAFPVPTDIRDELFELYSLANGTVEYQACFLDFFIWPDFAYVVLGYVPVACDYEGDPPFPKMVPIMTSLGGGRISGSE